MPNNPGRLPGAALLAIVVTLLGVLPQPAPAAGVPTLELGAPAPDFQLVGIDDKAYGLADFSEARLLAIVFTANHCPTAQSYESRMIQLVEDYADRGVQLVAISPNDPRAVQPGELGYTDLGDTLEDMKLRAAHRGFNFPYLYDGDEQAAAKVYGPVATPHVFIFDAERKLRFVGRFDSTEEGVGPKTIHSTRNALDELLAGKPVSEPQTKVFGCSIKWSEKRAAARRGDERWAQQEVMLEPISAEGVRQLARNDSEKLRLINVWATWCGPCAIEYPELVKIQRSYGQRRFEFVSLSSDAPDRREAVHAFLKEKQSAVTNYIFDTDDQYALIEALDERWGGALPYTMLVESGGEVLYRYEGELDLLELKREIVEILGREKDW